MPSRFLTFSLALCLSLSAFAEAHASDGIVADQVSKFGGEYIVTATSNAVKIMRKDGRLTMITKAPQWKVAVLNNVNHTLFETDWTRFAGGVMGNVFVNQLRDLNGGRWHELPDETVCGMTTEKFSMSKPVLHEKQDERFQLEHYSLRKATAYFLPQPQLSPAGAAVVGRVLISPENSASSP